MLRISLEVARLAGVVFADRNASSDWVRFLHPSQWGVLDFDAIFAMDWRDPNRFAYYEKKSKKCAEVLVPERVEPGFLTGAYVVDQTAATHLAASGFALPVQVEPVLFFR